MTDADLIELLAQAVEQLLANDQRLLGLDAHEQTITHRLGLYLQRLLPSWNVDCEYNRNGQTVKRLPLDPDHPLPEVRAELGEPIKPDIVVHHRELKDNLLVVEVKKLGKGHLDKDDWKLRGMTKPGGQYEYQLGAQVILDCEKSLLDAVKVYDGGEPNDELSQAAAARLLVQ